ncbi:hypothetical protein [Kitasatospora indigofera]|uniref:hypothetical protein n=1 Tax=Kitasatospora indigofera TaxID=67307 RepID=UPI00167D1BBE|nr:hypothetical protein [Kitasatospora indigofera]
MKPIGRSRRTTVLAGPTAAGTLTVALTACSDGGSASDSTTSTAFTTPAAVPTAPAGSDPFTAAPSVAKCSDGSLPGEFTNGRSADFCIPVMSPTTSRVTAVEYWDSPCTLGNGITWK